MFLGYFGAAPAGKQPVAPFSKHVLNAMPAVYEHHHAVRDEELDSIGRVNNVEYVRWMLEAALAHSAAQGWSDTLYRRLGRGWVARSHHIEYLKPALPGDEIVVRTWVATMKKATSMRRYHILRRADETLLAEAQTNWVFIRFDTGMPTRIPPEIAQAFEIV